MRKIYSTVIIGLSLLAFTGVSFAAYDYVQLLQSDSVKTRTDALKRIERGILSQPEVFKQVKSNMDQELNAGIDRDADKLRLDEVAWMCKALASSGDEQYLSTIEMTINSTGNKRLKGHCQKSIDNFSRYVEKRSMKKSPKISGFSQEMSSYINMLHSSDYMIKRDGIKFIMSSPESNEQVFDMVRDELLKEVPNITGRSGYNAVDAMSYACLCLSGSGISKYKSDLETVINQSSNKKLIKYARQAYNEL